MAKRSETLFCIAIFSLVVLSNASTYKYFRFVQQWPPATCTNAAKRPCKGKNQEKFTIHGFWPSNYTDEVPECTGTPFDKALIDKKQRKNLDRYWPDVLDGDNLDFWKYQWSKHGTCSEEKFNQTEYFNLALKNRKNKKYNLLKILKRAHLRPSRSKKRKLVDIQRAIQNKIKVLPAVRCNYVRGSKSKKQQLHEIVLCFREDGVELRNCFRSSCPDEFYWFPRKSSGFLAHVRELKETILDDQFTLGNVVLVMIVLSIYFILKKKNRRTPREDESKQE